MTNNNPGDLPEDHFTEIVSSQYDDLKRQHWDNVKDLDDNDPQKILYFRRFTEDFRSTTWFKPELMARSEPNFKYYAPNVSRKREIPEVEPHQTSLSIPAAKKLGILIGYHHLEKPWGLLFKDMFEKQVDYNPSRIGFILIRNRDIPTGDQSPESEEEIKTAVEEKGLTHLIDVHEQLAMLNHYMDISIPGIPFDDGFRYDSRKHPNGGEYTLDPFVPLWCIEQYFQGNLYPQLQYAVNDQIKKIEVLVKNIER